MEPTVCQAPIRSERQYRATSGEIQGSGVLSPYGGEEQKTAIRVFKSPTRN